MDRIPLWTLIPITLAIALALTVLFLSRRNKWIESDPGMDSAPVSNTDENKSKTLRKFLTAYRWELSLAAAVLAVMLYAWMSAPVQMTGEIPNSPNTPGRPFYFIHWQRNHLILFYNQTASAVNLLCGFAALALSTFTAIKKSPRKAHAALLWGFLSLAAAAQWMISSESQRAVGVALYLIAGAGFLLWSLLNQANLHNDINEARPIPFRWEVICVIAVLTVAAFGRMFQLKSIPYGIEGDEAKWTAEVVWLGLRGEPDSNGLYHRDALPVSFYMQTLFHKIMGPSLYAARFEVAFFSVLATFVFYLFLRQVTAMPLALLASYLLSASIFDISASRLANVESHVKLWAVLTFALLAWALNKKHWAAYSMAGFALALGLLTYDTVWPLVLATLIITLAEFKREKANFADALRNIMALTTPLMLTLPFLVPYAAGRMSYYSLDSKGWDAGAVTLWNHFRDVVVSWYVRPFEDFLYNRNGPILNAFLLPWLTLGFAASLASIRRRLPFWTLCWFLLIVLPVPIATHSPLGRVYYPALPAAYIFAAIGFILFVRESIRALGISIRPVAAAISIAVLLWLPFFNLYIYFNEVYEFSDRQMRREAAELAGDAAGPDNFIVLASVPRANEALNNEYQMIELFMMEKLSIEGLGEAYKNVPLEEVLPGLHDLSPRMKRSVILDKFTPTDRQRRDDLAKALRRCYPRAEWTEGRFFDRVDIDAESIANPACVSTVITLGQSSADTFTWSLSQGAASQVSLRCEQLLADRSWIEAETLAMTPGWQTETAFAEGWNGDGFIMDNFGASPLTLSGAEEKNGQLYFWVRYYKRVVDNSPIELTVNGRTYTFGRIGLEKINQWQWERLGPYDVPAGVFTALLSRPFNDEAPKFMAIFIDIIAYTQDPNFLPTDQHFQPLKPVTRSFRDDQSRGVFTARFEPGSYRCYAEAANRNIPLVDAFGFSPVKSGIIEFTIE